MKSVRFLLGFLLMMGLVACDDKKTPPPESSRVSQESAQFRTVQAIDHLQQQLQINPNDFASLSRIGDLYFESGQYVLAIQAYDKALTFNAECADCLNDKGLAQFYIGDIEGALTSLEESTSIDPNYPNAWLSLGYVLFSVGRYQDAIAPLKQVSVMDSSDALNAEADKFLAMIEERLRQE